MSMPDEKKTWVALIRGIGPATHKVLTMKDLRRACEESGFDDVRTILATGNLIVSSSEDQIHIQKSISGIFRSAGLENEVFLRRPEDLRRIIATSPLGEAISRRPSKVLVLFLAAELTPAAVSDLCDQRHAEKIEIMGHEIFIDYVNGVAGSRLIPSLVERRIGRPVTARNWNTVLRLNKDVRSV